MPLNLPLTECDKMILREYLKIRGKRAKALTDFECRQIGIKLRSGWPERHANVEVPDFLVQMVLRTGGVECFKTHTKKDRKAYRKRCREEDSNREMTEEYIRIMQK